MTSADRIKEEWYLAPILSTTPPPAPIKDLLAQLVELVRSVADEIGEN